MQYDEGLKVGYKWYDAENKPVLFPFGYGLSYTTYRYSDLKVTPGTATTVSFTVTNTGSRAGAEIAEVYAALPASADEPPKRLVGWSKVWLKAGEGKTVSVTVDPQYLSVYDGGHRRVEGGAGRLHLHGGRIVAGSAAGRKDQCAVDQVRRSACRDQCTEISVP